MKCATLVLFSFLVIACGKSAEEQARDDVNKEMAKQQRDNPPPPPEPKAVAEAPKKEKPPADPEPTTPEEIEVGTSKKAMIDGRDKDVIKYCEQGKLDDKTDAQVYMGCTLAACRINEADKARAWGKALAKSKPLMDQARKVCLANKVAL